MQRKPRRGSVIPLELIAIEEANIRAAIAEWCAHWHPDGFGSEASQRLIEDMFVRRLQANDKTRLDAAFVVDLALRGHPSADAALRRIIQLAIEADRFQSLPTSTRDYARRVVGQAPLAGYPSQSSQAVNHFLRDAALVVLMRRIKARWPAVPLLNSTGRDSVAALVGPAFNLSERQARRIYQADRGQSWRVVEFLTSRPNGALPNGPGHKDLGRR